jgi:alpha-beta hydrolase superfamily lysophospholipase
MAQWPKTPRALVRRVTALVVAAIAVFNMIAFRHAWAFTHPSAQATRVDLRHASLTDAMALAVIGAPQPRAINRKGPRDYGLTSQRYIIPAEGRRPLMEGWLQPAPSSDTVVVMLHGHGGSKSELLPHAVVLHELGLTTFLVDFPGAGGSGDAASTLGWNEATDVARCVRYVRAVAAPRRVLLYGLSMGAVAALKAMAEGTSVDGAILECPFDSLLATVEHRFETVHLPAFPAAHALLFWGGIQLGFDPFHHGALRYAPNVREPVLLMSGDRDPWVTVQETQSIFEALGGPKRLEICRTVGHASCLSRRPDQWTAAVRDFVADLK